MKYCEEEYGNPDVRFHANKDNSQITGLPWIIRLSVSQPSESQMRGGKISNLFLCQLARRARSRWTRNMTLSGIRRVM